VAGKPLRPPHRTDIRRNPIRLSLNRLLSSIACLRFTGLCEHTTSLHFCQIQLFLNNKADQDHGNNANTGGEAAFKGLRPDAQQGAIG
jgi:hypothetical protein